jgi:hypothetical protein
VLEQKDREAAKREILQSIDEDKSSSATMKKRIDTFMQMYSDDNWKEEVIKAHADKKQKKKIITKKTINNIYIDNSNCVKDILRIIDDAEQYFDDSDRDSEYKNEIILCADKKIEDLLEDATDEEIKWIGNQEKPDGLQRRAQLFKDKYNKY